MADARLYPFWANLTEGLRNGAPQNEAKDGGDMFEAVYADPAKLAQFASAMSSISVPCGAGDRGEVPVERLQQHD